MGEQMVARSYGINSFEKGLFITQTLKFLYVSEVFENVRGISKQAHSYFLYVGFPRGATKFFGIEGEKMRCSEIQIGGNSFRKIQYAFRKIVICL